MSAENVEVVEVEVIEEKKETKKKPINMMARLRILLWMVGIFYPLFLILLWLLLLWNRFWAYMEERQRRKVDRLKWRVIQKIAIEKSNKKND